MCLDQKILQYKLSVSKLMAAQFAQVYTSVNPTSMLPSVMASVQGMSNATFYIDNNRADTYMFGDGCLYSNSRGPATNCTDSPVLATEVVLENEVSATGPVFNNQNAGGYTGVTGTLNNWSLELMNNVNGQPSAPNSNFTVYTNQLYITNVTYDNWLYDQPADSGAIGLGPGSAYMWQLNSNTTLPANQTVWSLEIGSIVNQTFAGSSYNTSWTPAMYIGSNLSSVFNPQDALGQEINLNSDGSKFFNLYGGAFFGKYIDTSPHFAQLLQQSVDPNSNVLPPNVIFAANLQGIQLPYSLYQQWVGLMTRISSTITADFHCKTRSSSFQNNFCYLAKSCNSTDYTSLWDYQFNFEFASKKPTMFVGLGSLAWDSNGVCMLGVTGSETYTNIAIGAFAMQNFNFLFNGTDNNNFAVNIIQSNWTSPQSSIDFKYVNNTNAAPAFSYVQNLTLTLKPTADGQAYTLATLGPYADQQYLISLNNSASFVYSSDCTQDVNFDVRSCSLEPLNAHPTWNLADNLPTNTTLISEQEYDSYKLTGYETQGSLCFQASPSDNLLYGYSQCSLSNTTTFYIVDRVDGHNSWNRWRSSYAGILGLDNASPLWDVVYGSSSLVAGLTKTYEIDFESETIVLGAYNQTKFNQTASMTISAVSSSQGNMFELSEFGFGKIYQNDSTAYFSSILNDEKSEYRNNTNMTLITLDTSSLILPLPLYYKFLNLLAIATKGAANCDYNNAEYEGGICILPGKCSDWEADLGDYSFKIAFADAQNTSQYLILPLSTWMFTNQFYLKNYFATDADFCYIDVQTQYNGFGQYNLDQQPIVFGLQFFKYVNMLRQSSSSVNQMTLALNDNGVASGAMIAQYFYTDGKNPFVVTPYYFSEPGVNNGDGMPMLFVDIAPGLTKNGVDNFQSMFYYNLESNAQTFVFNQTCTSKITGVKLNCTQAPVNAVSQNFSNMGAVETQESELHTSGYDLRGSHLIQQLTFHPTSSASFSTVQSLFAVNKTLANYWLYNQTALYGQIALGPNSPFTYQFIDPESLFQEYSIGNATLYFGGHQEFSEIQNGTVFMTGDLIDIQTYAYKHVMFGEIYLKDNKPFNSYFSQLDTTNANLGLVFLQNFPGIGLPTPLYTNFNALMSNLSDNSGFSYSCNTTVGSVCTVYERCSTLTQHFSNYAFQFIFSKLSGVNVLTVPLSNFIQDNGDTCNLGVYYLDYEQNTQSNNVIVGAKFWQTFQANITNKYDVKSYTLLSQQIAISANADSILSYAGQTALPNNGPNPFLPGPHQYHCEINPKTFMPELMASFNSTEYQTYLIDNNAKKSLIWTTSCLQAMNSQGNINNCSAAPTYVTEWYDLNQSFIAPNTYIGAEQGGYITDGNELTAPMSIPLFNDGVNNDTLNITVRAVTDITGDEWQYNMQGQPSGQFALGWNSDWVMQQTNAKNESVWGISFTSSAASNQQCQIYVGDGTYNDLYNGDSTQLYKQNTTDNTYSLYSMWFGYNNSESANSTNYFLPLGYNGAPQQAIIALNYQGLGLPSYYWWQFANLLSRVSHIVQNDLFIDNDTGLFYLSGQCKNTDYDDLWHYFISVEMFHAYGGSTGNNTEYIQVPLASFAQYNSSLDACMLYIQLLNSHEGLPQTDKVVLGSMFLQNFQMLYVTDYSTTPAASGVAMDVSAFGKTVLASIGNLNYTQDASPAFDYAVRKELPLSCSTQSMLCTLQADLGFQGFEQDESNQNYLVSFTDSWLYALDRNCQDETTATFTRCSSGQQFNTDSSYGAPVDDIYTTNQIYMDGVETDVQTWNQTACLYYGVESEWPYCTPTNVPFYVGESIQSDAWGFMNSGAAGIFGFAPGSPIYGIINPLIGQQYQNFSLSVSNFTDWSFAQPNKTVAHHSSSYLAFGESQYVNMSGTNTSIVYTSSVYGAPGVFSVEEFGFGMLYGMNYSDVANSVNVTQSFQSINNMNSFVYGTFANQTVMTPSFRGLGLPETPYNRFSNLLSIATAGASNCNLDGLDWCVLPKSCDNYPDLWQYQFQIVLNSQLTANGTAARTMYLPLATFANTNADSGNCRIYVEKLDPTQQQIVLGSMFFQSFFYEQIAANDTYFQVALMRNFNALDNCFITTDVYAESKTSAFVVQEATPITRDDVANQPTLGAQIGGQLNNTASYTFDYTSDQTLVWASNCTTTQNKSCSASPNNVMPMFTPTNTSSLWVSSYTGISIGGYNTSGQIYSTDICTTSISECKLMNVYAADTLISNDWNSGVQGAWGVLGYGPRSPLWQSYISTGGVAQGSTVLMANTTTAATKGVGAYYDANEVVFGGTGSLSTYSQNSSVTMTANMLGEQPVFDIKTFSFGAVYIQNNSAYFEDFNQTASSVFTTNFQGLGLPTKLYSIYEQLLYTAGINYNVPITCGNATDGLCSFTGSCANSSAMLNDLTFSVTFNDTTSSSNGNYVNIPLQAFAYQTGNTCVIDVTDLSGAQSQNVVFGAQFYQAFFVAQQQVYALTGGVDTLIGQDLQIFVSHDNTYATANVTNIDFPVGPNPFAPVPVPPSPTPSSSNAGWIIALVIVFLILAAFLGWAVYKWRSTNQEQVNVYEQNNSAGEQKLIHSSGNINEDEEDV